MNAPLEYVLHLADNALILGQRNAEWCGHGPILEEDIALANVSLDLIGQARLLYQYAAELRGGGATEDKLAYLREVREFRNYTLLELPHSGPLSGYARGDRDYATTIVRNFLFSSLMVLYWEALANSRDERLVAIAEKSVKEVRYHLRHARDWLVKLGDGTEDSHARVSAAVEHLMPYTREFWVRSDAESQAIANGTGVDVASLKPQWDAIIDDAFAEATLARPQDAPGYITQGKTGVHSEHLEYVLAEMQSLVRQYPNASW
jgi:ring-1,2-phenylacetyl-CoA epoxidase subunit PaaC